MIVRIIGRNYTGEWMRVENGKEEEISKKLMELQEKGAEELKVEQQVVKDVTELFAAKYYEKDGTKMYFGNGNQPSYVKKYALKSNVKRKEQKVNHPNIIVGTIDRDGMPYTYVEENQED